jgi:hypothetical protein
MTLTSAVFAGDVVTQRFTMWCSGWYDEGYIDPTDAAYINETGAETSKANNANDTLTYKYMLRKGPVVIPIAEGGLMIKS